MQGHDRQISRSDSQDGTLLSVQQRLKIKKKLKPDKFFMGNPSQNYGVPPKYGALYRVAVFTETAASHRL